MGNAEISTIAASFEVTCSQWNKQAPNDTVLFRIRKTGSVDEQDGDPEKGWLVALCDAKKCTFIKSIENDTELIMDGADGELSHIDMRRVVASRCSEDMSHDLEHAALKFKEAVRRTLNLVRVFQLI